MKTLHLALVLFNLLQVPATAQILKPAKWSWAPSATSVKAGDELELIFTVTTDKN